MKFLTKLGLACITVFTVIACNSESDINEIETSSSSILSKDNSDFQVNGVPAWFGEELIYYYTHPETQEPMMGEASNFEWTECGGLGSNCVFAFGGCLTGNEPTSSTGTKVLIGIRDGIKLDVKLLEGHITHETFFNNLAQNETSTSAFNELVNFVNLTEDARITDSNIINKLHLNTNMVVIPAGRYRIDYSNSEFGELTFPIQY